MKRPPRAQRANCGISAAVSHFTRRRTCASDSPTRAPNVVNGSREPMTRGRKASPPAPDGAWTAARRKLHQTIRKVTGDVAELDHRTASQYDGAPPPVAAVGGAYRSPDTWPAVAEPLRFLLRNERAFGKDEGSGPNLIRLC